MNAGNSMDVLIAEHVMKEPVWELWYNNAGILVSQFPDARTYVFLKKEDAVKTKRMFEEQGWKCSLMTPSARPYSTDISEAWEVVKQVQARRKTKISLETYDGDIWSIKPCGVSSHSAAHAICLAALKSIGIIK